MDFKDVDIYPILKSSLPQRFNDMPPSDFEDFIAFLFDKKGYKVTQTDYSGDFGADLIVKCDEESWAVQVKRYKKGNKVSPSDVNQVIGAKDKYECDKALIITTSSYTSSAKELCEETDVENWAWEKLLKEISSVFFDGQDFYDYFEDEIEDESQNLNLDFNLKDIKNSVKMDDGNLYTLIIYQVKNKSNKNVNIALNNVLHISSKDKLQNSMDYWYEGYFQGGMIYAGAKVEVGFMFKTEKVNQINRGDKIVFEIIDESQKLVRKIDNIGGPKVETSEGEFGDVLPEFKNDSVEENKKDEGVKLEKKKEKNSSNRLIIGAVVIIIFLLIGLVLGSG